MYTICPSLHISSRRQVLGSQQLHSLSTVWVVLQSAFTIVVLQSLKFKLIYTLRSEYNFFFNVVLIEPQICQKRALFQLI